MQPGQSRRACSAIVLGFPSRNSSREPREMQFRSLRALVRVNYGWRSLSLQAECRPYHFPCNVSQTSRRLAGLAELYQKHTRENQLAAGSYSRETTLVRP